MPNDDNYITNQATNVINGSYNPSSFGKPIVDASKWKTAEHSFMEIYPRGKDYKRAKLYVIHDSLEVNPDMDITVTELYRGKTGRVHKHFFNKGRGGISFKCSVIIDQKTRYGKKLFHKALSDWINNAVIFRVATKAIDVPNGHYIITKNSARKQGVSHYTVWDLEFTEYNELKTFVWKNNNKTILTALKKKDNKTAEKGAKSKGKTNNALNKAFKKCPWQGLQYNPNKSYSCVKLLQRILQKNNLYLKDKKGKKLKVDGKYGINTVQAVAKYQRKKNIKKSKKNGNMDKPTFDMLCKS